MASSRRSNEDAPTPITEYEKEQLANIAINKKKLESLNIPTTLQPSQPRKRTKVSLTTMNTIIQ